MKKLLLILSLVLFSTPSFAEWKHVIFSELGDSYIDEKRIKKKGEYVYFWQLANVTNTKKIKTFKSYMAYYKADCSELSYTQLQIDIYETNMATGAPSSTKSNQQKRFAIPNSVLEKMINYACKYVNN